MNLRDWWDRRPLFLPVDDDVVVWEVCFVTDFVGGNARSSINTGIQCCGMFRTDDIELHCLRSVGVPLTSSSLRKLNAPLVQLAYASLRVTLPCLPIPSLVVLKLVRGVVDQLFSRL